MSTNENETVTGQENETVYFQVTDGVISLKADYRGDGKADYPASLGNNKKLPLPDVLVIPKQIGDDVVTSLAEGMFYNNKRVKEIVLPDGIKEIPKFCCTYATNLRTVYCTKNITSIGEGAFAYTRIKEALFPRLGKGQSPNMGTLGQFAFLMCGYLEVADIGAVLEIPFKAFSHCVLLKDVRWEGTEVSIGAKAFLYTRSLRELPMLAHVKQVEDSAFYWSRISNTLPASSLVSVKAFPTFDNETDFWTGIKFTPRRNRIITKLGQSNTNWTNDPFLEDNGRPYGAACALFTVMHIHSAITGKYYTHPEQFVNELKQNGLSQFLYYDNWPGQFHNVAPMFEAMGYRTEVHGTDCDLSKKDYKALVDAMARGAYIYAQVSGESSWNGNWNEGKPDGGHAVMLYGINDLGEVCVLDSNTLAHDHYQEYGFEPATDIYTYTIPYQNIAGPSSNFVIVYPTGEETIAKCTGRSVTKACATDCLPESSCDCPGIMVSNKKILSDTLPFELPAGVNISVVSTAYEWEKFPEAKEGYITTYHLFSSPAHVREEWQPNGSINKYVRYATGTGKWSDWYVVASTIYTPQENAE